MRELGHKYAEDQRCEADLRGEEGRWLGVVFLKQLVNRGPCLALR